MSFWNDLSRFAGNATGGLIGESDEERKKKEELKRQARERARAAMAAAQTPKAPQKPVQRTQTSGVATFSTPKPSAQPTVAKRPTTFGLDDEEEVLKTPQQRLKERAEAELNKKRRLDGTVIDERPMPAQVPGDAVAQANEALKAGQGLKDVGNYWQSDAEALRRELAKPNPNQKVVAGLTTSIKNRKGEIDKMNSTMSRDEREEVARKNMEARGGKFNNGRTFVGDVVTGIGKGLVDTIGAPAATIAAHQNQEIINQQLTELNERFKRGEITEGRMREEYAALTDGVIGNKTKVTKDGIRQATLGEDVARFGGQFAETGVNAYVGGGTAINAAARVGEEVVKQSVGAIVKNALSTGLKESAITGTIQTGADIAQDRGVSAGSLLANYGLDAAGNVTGEALGPLLRRALTKDNVEAATEAINQQLRQQGSNETVTPTQVEEQMRQEIVAQAQQATPGVDPVAPTQPVEAYRPVTQNLVEDAEGNLIRTDNGEIINEQPSAGFDNAVPKPRNNLLDTTDARERFGRPRDLGEPTNPESQAALVQQELNARVAQLPDDNYITQVSQRFGMTPEAVARLMQKTGKADLFNKLNEAAEFIRGANSPDAAATSIINKATDAGRAAAARAGVTVPEPTKPAGETATEMIRRMQAEGKSPEEINFAYMTKHADEADVVEDAAADMNVAMLSQQAKNSLENDTTGQKPGGVERSGGFVENGNAIPVEYRRLEDGSIAIVDGRHTLEYARQNGITDFPVKDVTEQYNAPEAPSVAQETGDAIKQAYEQEQAVWQAIDDDLTAQGFDPADIRRKMTAADRGEYKPTREEKQAFTAIQSELNSARERLAANGVEFDGSRQYYRPEQKDGTVRTDPADYSREDLLDFGYSKSRTGNMELDEIDYTANPEIDYTFKARNRGLVVENAIARSAEIDGRTVTRESVKEAADLTVKLQDTVKAAASRSEKVMKHDTVGDLNAIGKAEGYEQTINGTKIGLIAQEPKNILEHAGIFDKGFEQYANSAGYASEVIRLADENGAAVTEALPGALAKAFPDGDKSSLDGITAWADKRLEDAAPEQRQAIVAAAFRMGAKAELTRLGKTTVFANTKLNKVVNEQLNRILVNDAYKRNFGQKLDNFIAHRINESLRGANVVSAMFEASDFFNIVADFGVKGLKDSKVGFGKVDGDTFGMSTRYGKANQHFMSDDLPKDAAKLEEIWSDDKTNIGQKLYESARNVRDKTLLFKYVEQWKTELFLREADQFYRAKGLEGKALVDMVNAHFDKTMLPSTALTINRLLGKAPKSLTQYLSWGINSTKRLGRTLVGGNEFGKYADMGRAERIVRGVGVEIVPKVATALALGVPITQVLGGRDWLGVSTGDYSGIEEEDRTALDEAVSLLSLSPALGAMANYYNHYRVNEERQEKLDKGESDTPVDSQWALTATGQTATMLIPYHSQYKKAAGVKEGQDRGYYTNRDGRIQYGAVGDLEAAVGMVTGKTMMPTARDYSDNPNLSSVLRGKATPADLVTKNQTVDNVSQSLGHDTARNYHRPLASSSYDKGYNEQAIEAFDAVAAKHGVNSPEAKRTMKNWLALGRTYNRVYDDFKKKNPTGFDTWIKTMGDDVLTPEKWKIYQGNPDAFKFMQQRKQLEARDLGRKIDPIYADKLDDGTAMDDEKRKMVMQQRAAFTGDDMRLQEFLYRQPWYKAFKDSEGSYYDSFEGEKDMKNKSERVKQWSALSDQLYTAKDNYALIKANQDIIAKYGFDSPQSKAWFKANGDAYQAQKLEYEKHRFGIVNQMRKLEGAGELTHEEWMAKIEFPKKDDDGKWTGGKYGNSYGKRGSSATDKELARTGANDRLTNFTGKLDGPKKVKAKQPDLIDVRKVVKQPSRANRKAPIRITI